MTDPLCKPWAHRHSRRDWLGGVSSAVAVGGLGGLVSPEVAAALEARDKQVLFVWIDGGMSQYESWDPKPNTTFGGPFRSIARAIHGVQISELMPQTAQCAQHLALVRNLCTQDNSHSTGVPLIQRGDPKVRRVTYTFFGSWVDRLLGA